MNDSKKSFVRQIFGMMTNPSGVLKSVLMNRQWYLSVVVSALAFGLFFLQTGLDLYRTGQTGYMSVVLSLAVGIGYGAVVIPLLALLLWAILKIGRVEMSMTQGISVFCLSYSGALIYGLAGLVFSLVMGWQTALAFGVSGVIWAVGPMTYTIRNVAGGSHRLSIPLATLAGVIVLVSWYYIGLGVSL